MQVEDTQCTVSRRDYSLVGLDTQLAEERGLASADWYACPISRKRLKELMQRRDGPAIRDTLIWFALLIGMGTLGYITWGTLWAIPAFAVYGILYGSASDSRWHECGHRTAFKTRWINDFVYEIASFGIVRESVPWRWSHTRHHSDTIIVGRDPEITAMRPPSLFRIATNFTYVRAAFREYSRMLLHCFGQLTADEATYIPHEERRKVYRNSKVYVAIYATVIGCSIATHSILPLMYIGLPSLYGTWLMYTFGLTQHAGLAEDVLDHRLNTRTVYMNPIFRFIYWNMNYHVEHHMFPMVPYHALPALHEEVKADMPPPYTSLWAAYREIVPTLFRQSRDPSYFVRRSLPTTAREVSAPMALATQGE